MCTTSHEVWTTLQNLFLAQSLTHVMQMRYQLVSLKKAAGTITKYFHKAKTLAACLGAAGKTLSPSEFSVYILVGLSTDYDSLVTSLRTRLDALSPH